MRVARSESRVVDIHNDGGHALLFLVARALTHRLGFTQYFAGTVTKFRQPRAELLFVRLAVVAIEHEAKSFDDRAIERQRITAEAEIDGSHNLAEDDIAA